MDLFVAFYAADDAFLTSEGTVDDADALAEVGLELVEVEDGDVAVVLGDDGVEVVDVAVGEGDDAAEGVALYGGHVAGEVAMRDVGHEVDGGHGGVVMA